MYHRQMLVINKLVNLTTIVLYVYVFYKENYSYMSTSLVGIHCTFRSVGFLFTGLWNNTGMKFSYKTRNNVPYLCVF